MELRIKKLLIFAFLGLCLLWGLFQAVSYLKVVSSEHPYAQASRWVYANAPKGSRILGVHWDDRVPISLPGLEPHSFGYVVEGPDLELRIYERDSEEKLVQMAAQLAKADFLIFPTPRIPGSIPRIPDEYRYSTSLLKLLYAEKLGYSFVKTVKTQQSFGPIVFGTDLADESISVYDNPRVSIFKNTEHLSVAEIRNRIQLADSFEPLPTLRQILSPAELGGVSTAIAKPIALDVLKWFFFIGILGYVFAPLATLAFAQAVDKGFGFARALGLLLFGVSTWLVCDLLAWPCNLQTCWIILIAWTLIALLVGLRMYGGSRRLFEAYSISSSAIFPAELVFWGAAVVFLLLRALQPEIFWGEKPMDFTFLNYFTRSEVVPPQDPWAAGNHMSYYYVGSFILGLLHKVCAVDPAVGYNLALATIAALLVSCAYSALLLATRRASFAFWGALAVIVLSNLDVAYLAFFEGRRINFDLYWASSRTLASPAINEYPFWSHLFADLHAHVILLPFAVLLIGFGISLFRTSTEEPLRALLWNRLVYGVILGSFIAINSWDFLSYGLLTGILLCARLVSDLQGRLQSFGKIFVRVFGEACLIALGALLVALPMYLAIKGVAGIYFGWVRGNEFDSIGQIVRHLGQWLILILFCAPYLLYRAGVFSKGIIWRLPLALLPASLPVLLAAASKLDRTTGIPWMIVGLSSLLAFIAALLLLARKAPPALRAASGLLLCAALILGGAELVFLMDRMNTIFKFYNAIWVLLGLVTVIFVVQILEWTGYWTAEFSDQPVSLMARTYRYATYMFCAVLALVCLAGSVINVQAMLRLQRVSGPRPTLDGTAWQAVNSADEYSLIDWMNKNIQGTPTILESYESSYGPYTRISMNTGLPTVLGWEHHIKQRGTSYEDVEQRKRALSIIYSSADLAETVRLLKKYSVQYVVIGELERRAYRQLNEAKFATHPESFLLLYKKGAVSLYKVLP